MWECECVIKWLTDCVCECISRMKFGAKTIYKKKAAASRRFWALFVLDFCVKLSTTNDGARGFHDREIRWCRRIIGIPVLNENLRKKNAKKMWKIRPVDPSPFPDPTRSREICCCRFVQNQTESHKIYHVPLTHTLAFWKRRRRKIETLQLFVAILFPCT